MSNAITDAARTIVNDDRYGYKLGGWGKASEDYGIDCRGFVKLVCNLAGLAVGAYTWTGDMRERMCAVGWEWHDGTDGIDDHNFCVLLHTKRSGEKTGHTAIYSDGRIFEAWHDYDGIAGDGSGNEVRERGYYEYPWDGYLTWDSKTSTNGGFDMADWFFVQGKSDTVYLVTSDGTMHALKSMAEYNFCKWCINKAISAKKSGEVLHLRVDSGDSSIDGGTYQTGAFLKMLQEILAR